MNPRILLLLALAVAAPAFAADEKKPNDKVKSDLVPPDKRRATVEIAQHLTRPPTPEPLPLELAQPFNPPGFDLPNRTEPLLLPGGPSGGPAGGGPTVVQPGGGPGNPGGPVAPVAPTPSEREKLDGLAAKIPATGTMMLRGERLLTFPGGKFVRIGADFTVTSSGQDYLLRLIAIDATTVTVRLGQDEVTRPITPRK